MERSSEVTSCAECVAALATTRLSDIPHDSSVAAHVSSCPDCSRLVNDMQLAERRLATSLDLSMPTMPPTKVAADAITRSERERRESVGRWLRRGLAFAAGILFVAFLRTDRGESLIRPNDYSKQSIEIDCLSPGAALRLAVPLLTSRTSVAYHPEKSSYVVLEGRRREVSAAADAIYRAQAASCAVRPGAPVEVSPQAGKQGRD